MEYKEEKSRLQTLEERAAVIQKFTLFSNAFISVALNDKETCQYVLRILTGNPRLCLKGVKTQYTILKMASHDAWLDVLAEDENGALYGLHTCYVNAEVDDKSEVAELMKYFVTADPEDMSHGALSKRVHYLKCEKAGWEEMCEVTDIFWRDGFIQGKYQGEQNSELRERCGRRQGRRQGRQQAERRFQRLIMAMTAAGEAKDLPRLGEDHAFLTEMYQKYHI